MFNWLRGGAKTPPAPLGERSEEAVGCTIKIPSSPFLRESYQLTVDLLEDGTSRGVVLSWTEINGTKRVTTVKDGIVLGNIDVPDVRQVFSFSLSDDDLLKLGNTCLDIYDAMCEDGFTRTSVRPDKKWPSIHRKQYVEVS